MDDITPVRTIRFGRTNVQVPVVSLGTWAFGGENMAGTRPVGWSGHDDQQAKAALVRAFELGITHWDTADVYGEGRSEALIGSMWDSVPRDRILLASKVGFDRGGHAEAYHPDVMQRQLERSLRHLKTDRIDVYYLHHCDFGHDDRMLDGAIRFVRDAQAKGLIRWVGLSNGDDHGIMRVIARVEPDVVQPLRNATHDHFHESGLAAWCHQHDVGVAFFSPIRQGLLLGKYPTPVTFPAGDVRANDKGFANAALLERLAGNAAALRARFERAPEPILGALVAALLFDAATGCALLGQRTPAQVEAAARASALRLDEEEVAWVRSLYTGIES
ncbi:MAG: aldo/keto reductase [Myxococcota bacterium]